MFEPGRSSIIEALKNYEIMLAYEEKLCNKIDKYLNFIVTRNYICLMKTFTFFFIFTIKYAII